VLLSIQPIKNFPQDESAGPLIAYALAMVLQIFLPCYFASAIQSKSERFVDDVIASSWTDKDEKYKKLLIIFMENLKTPRKIMIFGVFKLNIETFQKVKPKLLIHMTRSRSFLFQIMNMTYSMYTILRTFKV